MNVSRVPLVVWIATLQGAVPLVLASRRRLSRAWWWLAMGFAMSTVVDLWQLVAGPRTDVWYLTFLFPVSQCVVIVAPLVTTGIALGVLLGMGWITVGSILAEGTAGPDVIAYGAACLVVLGVTVAQRRAMGPRLRAALWTYFGVGLVAWCAHVLWLTVPSWYAYQGTRLAGLALFCWAASVEDAPLMPPLVA